MRAIVFIHRGGPQMASYRYRAQMPADYLKTSVNGGPCEIAVFSKPCEEDLALAKDLKAKGSKIVVDFCDDHFKHKSLGMIYREMAEIADHIVCPTDVMASRIPVTRPMAVIPDPAETQARIPHADGDSLLWFGHSSNLKAIEPHAKLPNLRIVSGPKSFDGVTLWSPQNIKRAMAEANICLFPTVNGDEYKSNNRFINAVNAGLFPVCNQHPSYAEFKGLAWLGGIQEGLRWCSQESEYLDDLVLEMQEIIKNKYSIDVVGEQWKSLLESI